MPHRARAGFSLVELMCVITIILILASLMMGPVLRAYKKARNFGWENDAPQLTDRFIDRMKQHFGEAPLYPELNVEQLFEGGLIDHQLRIFLKDKRVQFFPFSSKAPDEMIVLEVTISKKATYIVRKGDLKPPKE